MSERSDSRVVSGCVVRSQMSLCHWPSTWGMAAPTCVCLPVSVFWSSRSETYAPHTPTFSRLTHNSQW